MTELFPAFNQQEQHVVGPIDEAHRDDLAEMLRLITVNLERNSPPSTSPDGELVQSSN